jgi:2-polyprenyl-3-methyl-5-hydroxy-6-metoxy-1,4-benzoquinol methylase
MTENGNQEIDVAQLMARIREAAEKRKSESLIDVSATLYRLLKTNGDHEVSNPAGLASLTHHPIPAVDLQPEFESRERYQLHDLVAFHDQAFVRNAYRAILKREPDEAGFAHYLASLRSGRFNKTELLAKLKYSPEGKQRQVEVDGLTRLSLLGRIYRVPMIGYLLEMLVGVLQLPALMANQRKLEAYAASQQDLLAERLEDISHRSDLIREESQAISQKIARFHQQQMKAVVKEMNELIEDQNRLKKNVSDHIAAMHERFRQETVAQGLQDDELQRLREMLETKVIRRVQQTRMALVLQERRLLLLLEEARKRLPAPLKESQIQSFETEKDHLLDSLYSSLEDDFRGTREEIKESVSFYLPILKDAGINSDIVDVGCGRGEWLEVMREAGLSARGVDFNRVMIERSRRAGLDAIEADALTYLRSQADNSLSCITAFHFVEHLPLPALISFLDECARTLKPGGLAVFETPNPENLLVGGCNFYLDPTHRNPLPATMMKFLLEARGFCRVEILPLHPPTPAVLKGDDDLTKQLNQKLFGPMDYAILGRTI